LGTHRFIIENTTTRINTSHYVWLRQHYGSEEVKRGEAQMRDIRNKYKFIVVNPLGKRP
jgi:hypothetical protein